MPYWNSRDTSGGIHMDSILADSVLPLKYVAFSHCFRTEAGAAGTATRAKLDKNEKLLDFVHNLEAACIETVETGKMTKDLAILVHGPKVSREYYLNMEEFTDAVAQNLESKLPAPSAV